MYFSLNAHLIPKYRQPFETLALMKAQTGPDEEFLGGKAADCKEWYGWVDSLRTILAQSGQNIETDMEELGELVRFVKK